MMFITEIIYIHISKTVDFPWRRIGVEGLTRAGSR